MNTVSEPIALKLRQVSGNIYLHAQVFAGLMYIGAALCMWILQAWKIQQLEKLAIEQEKNSVEMDPLTPQAIEHSLNARRIYLASTASNLKHLLAWKRV